MNDIQLNLVNNSAGSAIMNVHLELDYTKGTQPNYTQPKDIFGVANFLAAVRPPMSSHDSYIFIEQNMGLPSGVIATPPSNTDTQAPAVSITAPANGTSVTKGTNLPISITAEDNVGIDKVMLYVDGSLNTTITHSPFSHQLVTTNLSAGSHTVYAQAYDTAGNNTRSNQVSFTVTDPTPADTTGPSVSITAPTSGQNVTGTVTVSATATDPSGVTRVDFFLDGSTTAFATDNQSPYSFSWNSANVGNGSHSITARATDSRNNTGNSTAVTFNVNNTVADTTAPTTNITSPSNNATVTGMTTITVNANDNVGVSRVELLIDGSVVAIDTQAPFGFSWDTSQYSVGTHKLRSRAFDAANNTGQSAEVTVTIPDSSNPITGISSPQNGATVSGTATIQATASDNVGISKVEFLIDGNVVGSDSSSPYSFSWNTTNTTNAGHTIRTRAVDTAGNVGYSLTLTVTVNNEDDNPPSNPTPKLGDANNDGKINVLDLQKLLFNWGKPNATWDQGDMNGDKVINVFDLQIILNNWGK